MVNAGSPRHRPGEGRGPRFSSPAPRRRVSFVVAATFAVLAFEACVALSAYLFI